MPKLLIALLGNSAALKAFADLVDSVFPFFVGNRTKIASLVCPLLSVAGPFVPPPYGAAVPIVQGVLCSAVPVFAAAGVIRDAQAQAKSSVGA
jgi:hypothetical protein